MGWMVRGYMRTLTAVLHHRLLMGVVMLATIAVTVNLYIKTPKGYFPQDDTGLVFGSTRGVGRHLLRRDGRSCSARRSTSCLPIRRLRLSAPRSARPASTPPSTRDACSSA